MDLDILVEDDRWTSCELEALAGRAVAETLAFLEVDGEAVEVSLLACDDARIVVLNGEFREKPQPTNVLSWPAEDLSADAAGDHPKPAKAGPDGVIALGDIAIAYDTCAREAAEMGKPIETHVTHLIVHGVLHLLGFDHIDDADAALMQGFETKILGKMGLDDPYREK